MNKQNNQSTEAILVVNFSYSITEEQLKAGAQDFAENAVPVIDGLKWKIFLNQPDKKRAGGIYLFRDAQSAGNYLDGSFVEKLKQTPGLTDFSFEVFETLTEASIKAKAAIGGNV